ncbi:hypothetical protein Taro_007499 [Colocasia esculenta]|uniref:Uncharacterized protein n=1 Tax=Colocasia esculenta TaxID=4460 RepID=A0A843TVJ8_COLES|nr:hypothetical protein [Colocasia esculenta]
MHRDDPTRFKGSVEELLVAEELWNAHTKPFFFPFSSAATCTNRPLEVDQSTMCQYKVTMKYMKRNKSRMGMRPSDERPNMRVYP